VGGGIAFQSWFSISDFQSYFSRKFTSHRSVFIGMKKHITLHAFFQKLGSIDQLLGNGNLVIIIHIHKMMTGRIVIKKLVSPVFDTDNVNFKPAGESVIQHFSVVKILQFCSYKSWSFTRFYVQEFNDLPWCIVKLDAQSIADI